MHIDHADGQIICGRACSRCDDRCKVPVSLAFLSLLPPAVLFALASALIKVSTRGSAHTSRRSGLGLVTPQLALRANQ